MSVVDRNVIDFYHVDDDRITLCISDHIPWEEDTTSAHLVVLQDKINDYLDFICSGQIYEEFGDEGKTPCIKVIFCYDPVDEATDFLEKVKAVLNEDGYELEWIFRPVEDEQ